MVITRQRLYFPLLDSTRFIAFIPVFLTHCFVSNNPTLQSIEWYVKLKQALQVGLLGLDYFFVLSSFLISRLIIEEVTQHQKFHFFRFFVRRSLRIWPIYFLMVIIGFSLSALDFTHGQIPSISYFISFTLNLYIAKHGYDFLFFLVFLWSISVEEQFYVAWGTLLAIVSRINKQVFKYTILIVSFVLIVGSLIYRATHTNAPLPLYFNTWSVCGNFGVGIMLAWLSAYSAAFIPFIKRIPFQFIILLTILLLVSVGAYTLLFQHVIAMVLERLYFSLLFALVIALMCYSNIVLMYVNIPAQLDYLGKISLGLYFYHGIAITGFTALMQRYTIAHELWQVLLLNPLLILLATIMMAGLSYRFIEVPFLKLKEWFYPNKASLH